MPTTLSKEEAVRLEQTYNELLRTETSFIRSLEKLLKGYPAYQAVLSAENYALLDKVLQENYQPLVENPFADLVFNADTEEGLQASLQALANVITSESQQQRFEHTARISFQYLSLLRFVKPAYEQAAAKRHVLPYLNDELIAPVQRFPRYSLLLNEMQKICPANSALTQAIATVKRHSKNIDNTLALCEGRYTLAQVESLIQAYNRQDIWVQARKDVEVMIKHLQPGQYEKVPGLLYQQLTAHLHHTDDDVLGKHYYYCKIWLETFFEQFSQSKALRTEQQQAFWDTLAKAEVLATLAFSGLSDELLQLCHDSCQKDLFFSYSNLSKLLQYWVPLTCLQDRNGYPLLHQVVYAQHLTHEQKLSLVNALSECGLSLATRSANQSTILHSAFRDRELLEKLLSHPKMIEANIYNHLNNEGMSILHLAATIANPEKCLATTKLVLPYCNPNLADAKNGQTALHQAIAYGSTDVVQLLLQHKAEVNKPDRYEVTPLHKAVMCNKREIVKLLVSRKANPSLADAEGYTPLHTAVSRGYDDIAELLITEGADVNLGDARNGCTPLYIAVAKNRRSLVILLLSRGANPNLAEAKHGATPLHIAVAMGYTAIIGHLLQHQANPNYYLKNDTRRLDVYADGFNNGTSDYLRENVEAFKPLGLFDKILGREPAPVVIAYAPVAKEALRAAVALQLPGSGNSMPDLSEIELDTESLPEQPSPQPLSVNSGHLVPGPAPAVPMPLRTIPFTDVRIERNQEGYKVRLGNAGGFGYVCKAQWMHVTVAVKELHALQPSAIAKFKQEAAILAMQVHPHIITLYGIHFDPIEERYWIVMEFAANGSLRSWLDNRAKENRPLSHQEQLEIATQIAKPLAYIHQHNILHLDLKADNVLITTKQPVHTFNEHAELKLTDFGLATPDENHIELISQPRGTLYWMAPEVLAFRPRQNLPRDHFTAAADIYSYSILLWELMTRAIPYHNLQPDDVSQQVRHEVVRLRPTPKKPEGANSDMVTLMHDCWKQAPSERPSAAELVSRLGLIRSGMQGAAIAPVTAAAPTPQAKAAAAKLSEVFSPI